MNRTEELEREINDIQIDFDTRCVDDISDDEIKDMEILKARLDERKKAEKEFVEFLKDFNNSGIFSESNREIIQDKIKELKNG